jgi:hypothetical protein
MIIFNRLTNFPYVRRYNLSENAKVKSAKSKSKFFYVNVMKFLALKVKGKTSKVKSRVTVTRYSVTGNGNALHFLGSSNGNAFALPWFRDNGNGNALQFKSNVNNPVVHLYFHSIPIMFFVS